jgi:DNA (cytosine-5)-methyltransferase 1
MEIAWQIEIDPFCCKVLEKHWPEVKRYGDIKKISGADLESVDIICGGFPCQPFSVAGKQRGNEDDRYLWPEMLRVIKEIRPTWIIGENVPGIISMALDQVLSDLEDQDYACQTFIIPACGVNAPHRRDRVWIVGYSEHNGLSASTVAGSIDKTSNDNPEGQDKTSESERAGRSGNCQDVADTSIARNGGLPIQPGRPLKTCADIDRDGEDVCNAASPGFPDWAGGEVEQPSPLTEFERPSGREIERDFRGISHGVSRRVDRLKSLGNAVVPQIPEIFGRMIMEIEEEG